MGELGVIITGKTPRTAIIENYNGKTPFLTPSDDLSIKYVYSTNKTLSDLGVNEVKNTLLPANSVCVSCIGSDLGKVVITTQPTVTNQQINSIIIDVKNFNFEFIYYSMIMLGDTLKFHSKTSTAVPIINKTTFSNYSILCPPLDIQERIAGILGALDDKIELNNQINNNLEQQAKALFKSWFVDFEPFGGKMPSDWNSTTLGAVCKCELGGTPSRVRPEYWGGSIPWINSGEVNKFRITKPSERITTLGLEKSATKLLPTKTTLIAITGATLGQISLLEIASCANQSVVGIIENNILPYEFIYPFICYNIHELIKHQTGGAQQHINKQNVEQFPLFLPSEKDIKEYKEKITPVYDLIANNCFENERLAELRDTLLPKLMSGEIDVSNVNISELTSTDKLSFSENKKQGDLE